jgi:hypothetical protein
LLTLPAEFPGDVEAFACDLDRTLIAEDGLATALLLLRLLSGGRLGVRSGLGVLALAPAPREHECG